MKIVFARLKKWHERRALENQMMSMSERELRDVGLSRADIPYVVRHGRTLEAAV